MNSSTARVTAEACGEWSLATDFQAALRDAAGIRFDPHAAIAQHTATRPMWSTWQEGLQAQLAESGLLLRELELDFESVRDLARPGAPLVTWSPEVGWVGLLDHDRRRVKLVRPEEAPEWVPHDRLVGVFGERWFETRRTWVALEMGLLGGATEEAKGPKEPFARLVDIVRPERADVAAIALYSAFIGISSLAIPVAVQQLVNTVAFGGLVQPVVVLALLMLLGLTVAAGLYAFQAYLAELLQRRIFVRGCLDLAYRLPRVREDAFGSDSAPAFVNRFFDLVTVQKAGARILIEGSGVVLQTTAGLVVLSFYHPLMLALSIFLLGAMAMVSYGMGRYAPRSAVHESTAKYEIAAWMEELVGHPTTFRTSASRRRAESRADRLVASWVDARRRHYKIVFRQYVTALGLQVVVNTGLLALGGFLVVVGELTLGQLVASEIIVASVVASFARLAKHFESYYDLLAAAHKVGGLFELPLERPPTGRDGSSRIGPGHLACREVTVEAAGQPVLEDLSLELAPGERVALVGRSGIGKSVLVDVLAGIRRPAAGYVTLDDYDLRDQSPQTTRDRICVVRMPQILPASILENVTIGTTEARLDEVQEALARVDLLDAVRRLPRGLDTPLDRHGAPLTRGQLLRLEIARAFLAKPAVIILDIDPNEQGDEAMVRALERVLDASQAWTVLVVARRVDAERRFDRVLEVDEKGVVDVQGRNASNPSSGESR